MGAKIPDHSSAKTLAQTFRGSLTLSTGASGELAYVFYPQYSYLPYASFGAGVLPAVTAWSNFAGSPAAITGSSSYRIVSTGFTLKRLTNDNNSQGVLQLRQWAGESLALYAGTDVSSYGSSVVYNQPFADLETVSCIPARTSHPVGNFLTVSLDSAQLTTAPLNKVAPVTIYVSGGPANTGVLFLEFVINYEVMFDDATALSQISTPPPPHNPLVTNAAAAVTSEVKTFFGNAITDVSKSLARSALSAIGRRFGLTPRNGNPMLIADVD